IVGDLTASGDIALRSRTGSLTVGSLVAGDDIVLRAAQGVTATSLKVGGAEHIGVGDQLFIDDPTSLGEGFSLLRSLIAVRAAGDVTASGELKAGQGADVAGIADRLVAVTGPTTLFGVETGAGGGVIDVSGASIRLIGAIAAAGDRGHLRLRSVGGTTLGDA